jgi:hypothetical protein
MVKKFKNRLTLAPEAQHQFIAAFSARLPLRPDAEQARFVLANAFAEHHGDLWPLGDPSATPEWIAANVDVVLATVERLYRVAIQGFPGSDEFLDRMEWLPALLVDLERLPRNSVHAMG